MNRERTRQYALFALFLVSSAILAVPCYHGVRKGWVAFRKGETLYAEHNFRDAIPVFVKSFQMGNSSPKLLKLLGDACVAEGRFPEAIEAYRFFLGKYPARSDVRISLARVLTWSGRFDEAVKEYRKALGEQP